MTAPLLVLDPRHWPQNTDEAMSASFRLAQEMDEAISEASGTAQAKEKERDW